LLVIHPESAPLPPPASLGGTSMWGSTIAEWEGHPVTYAVEPDAELNALLTQYAARPITSFSLRQLYQFGFNNTERNLLASARFLHSELSIRFAQRVQFVRDLPYHIGESPLMRAVQRHYTGSFALINKTPCPETFEDAKKFTELVRFFLSRSTSANAASLSLIICHASDHRLRKAAEARVTHAARTHRTTAPASDPLSTSANNSGNNSAATYPAPAGSGSADAKSPSSSLSNEALASAASAAAARGESLPPCPLSVLAPEHFILQDCVDQFHASRLEARVLIAHHLALFSPRPGTYHFYDSTMRQFVDIVFNAEFNL